MKLAMVSPEAPQFTAMSRTLARKLARAGYRFGTCYPGSPIVQIARELERLSDDAQLTFRYATNEKVAFEMAAAVAIAGGRAFCLMKHVGANVALDSVVALSCMGHRGSLLLIVGDDPACESSSAVQDSRQLARLLGVPCIEPASIEEVGAAVDRATEISEQREILVVLRLTMPLCHGSALLPPDADSFFFEESQSAPAIPLKPPRSERRFLLLPAVTRELRPVQLERLAAAREQGAASPFFEENDTSKSCQSGELGFVVQNALHYTFMRAAGRLGLSPATFRTLMPWPLSDEAILPFLRKYRRIVVVEELEPVLEDQVIRIAHQHEVAVRVSGSEHFSRTLDLDEERLYTELGALLGIEVPKRASELLFPLEPRGPTFCAGCPHTASFYALKGFIDSLPERPFIASDIGCYTLGTKAGIELGDTVLAMGASIGVATGMALQGTKTLALIGDSTFLHAGLPALYNAVELGADLLVCIFDNGVAAMTGGQSTTQDAGRLHAAVLGLGVASATVVDPFDTERSAEALRSAFATRGTSVVIFRSPCALTMLAKPQRPVVDLAACTGCGDCVTRIHCPAISLSSVGKFQVDVDVCVGCGFCSRICPEKALTPQPFERAHT